MFNSKFTIFIISILILTIAIICYANLTDTQINQDSTDLNENTDDIVYIWMEDKNGNIKLTPTTHTHSKASASAPT